MVKPIRRVSQLYRSLNLLTCIEYCRKLNNKDAEMVQMYWTQTGLKRYIDLFSL